jgi:uncharacterized cupredoxin-like copper-binding protein
MSGHRRPGRLALAGGIALSVGLAGIAAAWTAVPGYGPDQTEIAIRYSHYTPAAITVRAGTALTVILRNDDPIDHEWIVGDAAVHERHRTGTEPVHNARPTEISIPARSERKTTITFAAADTLQYICHLPGHEAYGMVGVLSITPGG